MQCSNPLTITNPKRMFRYGYDKPLLTVNCGRCLSCAHMKQNDWILRGYFHFLKYTEHERGSVFFATLTYKDSSLPYYYNGDIVRGIPSLPVHGRDFACFNHDDIDKFLNSFRQFFLRKFNIKGISYFCGCEYGSHRTKRPHYHILLFIPYMDRLSSFGGIHYSKHVQFVKDMITHYWQEEQDNGFVIFSPQSKGGARISSHLAIKYVSKYCTKDLDFYNDKTINLLLKQDGKREQLKRFIPSHWQSQGFGSYMADYILNSSNAVDILSNGFALPVTKDCANLYYQSVPSYIIDKLFNNTIYEQHTEIRLNSKYKFHEYKVTDHIYKTLSDYGYNFKCSTLERQVSEHAHSLQMAMSLPKLCLNLPQNFLVQAITSQVLDKPCNNVNELHSKIHELLGNYSPVDLAVYKVVYRGNCIPNHFIYSSADNLLDSKVYSYYYGEILRYKVKFDPQTAKLRDCNPRVYGYRCFDSLNRQFRNFETVLRLLDLCQSWCSGRVAKSNFDIYRQSKYLKEHLHKY